MLGLWACEARPQPQHFTLVQEIHLCSAVNNVILLYRNLESEAKEEMKMAKDKGKGKDKGKDKKKKKEKKKEK
jgi:hypothetical protein